ncbi:glycosyltransferase [Nocardioides sp. SYSU D00038]|uniref:glycosyltransferase n=1 Tax=Nocardioides sp. SYSU D00038 TaxID=2812554 RepID=UPI001967ACBD|nr:glycosyltransferase [Nocardioides sp. SYSU D00038]
MRICLVASSRHPIRQPFAGGLESLTHQLCHELTARGHDVTLFAGPGSDPALPVEVLDVPAFEPSAAAMADVNAPSRTWLAEHHAYLGLMLALGSRWADRFDVVHNNSLHHLPVAMAGSVPMQVVTTLHTPPLPWLESAVALAPGSSTFAAVSRSTARGWAHVVRSEVVPNGVDTDVFRAGPGGGPAVWSGRLVPEKAPHLAIEACRRAGVPLVLAGPVSDPAYVEREVLPRLGPDVELAGHLGRDELVALLGRASVAVVTPAWEEPYGLVCAEALACGTPVAAFDRGAMREILSPRTGRLARSGDVDALARAVARAATLDRDECRVHAVAHCSVARMVDGYERLYERAGRQDRAA